MAEQTQPHRPEPRWEPSALISRLVPDPTQSPDVQLVVGFPGQSAQAGYVRLYLTPELNGYLEIREEDVVHTQALATAQNPLGGHAVWLKQNAVVQHTLTIARQVQAGFLQGSITAGFLPP